MLGDGRSDRRAGARARRWCYARAARASGLVRADRGQPRPVPRLDGVRAARDRHRRRGALGRAVRLRAPSGPGRSSSARWRWCSDCSARSGSCAACVRTVARLGRAGGPRLPRPGGPSTAATSARLGHTRARAASRSGRGRTSSSASPSRGSRSPPTTRASRATARTRSGARASAIRPGRLLLALGAVLVLHAGRRRPGGAARRRRRGWRSSRCSRCSR